MTKQTKTILGIAIAVGVGYIVWKKMGGKKANATGFVRTGKRAPGRMGPRSCSEGGQCAPPEVLCAANECEGGYCFVKVNGATYSDNPHMGNPNDYTYVKVKCGSI